MKKEYQVRFKTSSALLTKTELKKCRKGYDKAYTINYTLEEAREAAKQIMIDEDYVRYCKIYKGREFIEQINR